MRYNLIIMKNAIVLEPDDDYTDTEEMLLDWEYHFKVTLYQATRPEPHWISVQHDMPLGCIWVEQGL